MRALVTNDDGIDATGLHVLAQAASTAGFDVTVVAPDVEASGSSARLSAVEADGRLLVANRRLPGVDAPAFAAHASPASIVFVAARGAFGEPPDVVLSGINHGLNTGQAVLHSGTVGAALTAATHGLPALALSLAAAHPKHWASAATITSQVLSWFLGHADQPVVLNVNLPDIPLTEWRGFQSAPLAAFGAVRARVGERGQDYVTVTFEEIETSAPDGTDLAAIRNGWASVTELTAPCQGFTLDLTSLASRDTQHLTGPTADRPLEHQAGTRPVRRTTG